MFEKSFDRRVDLTVTVFRSRHESIIIMDTLDDRSGRSSPSLEVIKDERLEEKHVLPFMTPNEITLLLVCIRVSVIREVEFGPVFTK